MSAPTNGTPATATRIGAVPYSVTTDPSLVGTTSPVPTCGTAEHGLWWMFTPTMAQTAIGISVTSADPSVDFQPACSIWSGPVDSLTQLSQCCYGFANPSHIRIEVHPLTTYYLLIASQFTGDATFAAYTLAVSALATAAPALSLIVPSDLGNQASIILDAATGVSLQALGLTSCEQADVVPSGRLLVLTESVVTSTTGTGWTLYDAGLRVPLATITTPLVAGQTAFAPVRSDAAQTFYVAGADHTNPAIIATISDTGVVGGMTWTLPSNSVLIAAMAPTRNGHTLYYCSVATNVAIHAYDLQTSMALSDFVAAPGANHNWSRDLWVTATGDVLVACCTNNSGATQPFEARRYNSSGTLQTTYSLGNNHTSEARLALSPDSTFFWSMTFNGTGGTIFQKFLIAGGGSPSLSFTVMENDNAGSGPIFGPSETCPLLILPVAVPGVIPPPDPATRQAIRVLRQFGPMSTENAMLFVGNLELLMNTGSGTTTGQGSDPQLMLSWSKDYGHTWSPERWLPIGKIGDYMARVRLPGNLGQGRGWCFRVVVTDPIPVTFLQMTAKLVKGTS